MLQICKEKRLSLRDAQPLQGNSHLLPIDVAVLDEGGAADVDGDVLRGLPVLDEALLHVVLLTLLLLQ